MSLKSALAENKSALEELEKQRQALMKSILSTELERLFDQHRDIWQIVVVREDSYDDQWYHGARGQYGSSVTINGRDKGYWDYVEWKNGGYQPKPGCEKEAALHDAVNKFFEGCETVFDQVLGHWVEVVATWDRKESKVVVEVERSL